MNDLITVLANVSLALSFVIGLVFGITQVRAAARDRRERLTLDTLRNFETREFVETMTFVISSRMPTSRAQLDALSQADRIMYIQFSQQMESLGILVAEGFIDIDLVDKILGSFVSSSWKKYKVIFSQFRETDPYIGEYFQWLAERLHAGMKNSPREPFYKIRNR